MPNQKGSTNGINKNVLKKVNNDVPYKRHNNTDKIILEEDFIKQPLLKLYAKLKGNTHGIKKPHAHASGTRDFEKKIVLLRVDVP